MTRRLEDYSAHLVSRRIEISKLRPDSRGTLLRTRGGGGVGALPRLRLEGDGADLLLESRVGSGGMGDVHLAIQRALARPVAVKTPRPGDSAAQASLIDEALVTGALEHPNVVPVHALGRGPDDEPMLIMKYIEGTRWSERAEALFPAQEDAPGDPLDEQLRIFAQVCNAVHFAHSRGVLHLDVKPDNVMVGRFGEVYLLDWGLAAATRDDAPGSLPLARDINDIGGTPAYMAPEMAAAEGSLIDERTDVYLLGATLHHLITGSPPHHGETLIDALNSAFRCEPPPLPSVPRELADVCRRAMAFDPVDRFASAEELRDAILGFVRHRSSSRVAAQGGERVRRLRELVKSDASDDEAIQDLATEARFGFQQALAEWPANPDARAGLEQLVEVMVAWQLARDDVRGATAALRDLPEPRPELSSRVEAHAQHMARGEKARASELAELRQIARDADMYGPHRGSLILLVSAVLIVPILVLGALRMFYGRASGYREAIVVAVMFTLAVIIVERKTGPHVPLATRRAQFGTIVFGAFAALLLLGCMLMGVELSVAFALMLLGHAAMAMVGAAFTQRAFSWVAVPLLLASVAIPLAPRYRAVWMAVAYTITALLARRLWDRPTAANRG